MSEWLHFHFSLSCIGEGNGNPLQCSCLENPRDGGAWWATIYGVAQSWARLKQLSSSSMQDFNHDLISIGDECNCPMVSAFFGTTLLEDWHEDWPFPALWPLLCLPNLLTYWMQNCPSWVAMHSMAHSFIELCKILHHDKMVIHVLSHLVMSDSLQPHGL